MELQRLPDAELEVMLIIWESGQSVNSEYLMNKLQGIKNWKRTTLLKLLERLCARGYLSCDRSGKVNLYSPLVSEKDYLEYESKSFIKRLHHGSLRSLVASLYDGNAISKEDLKEIEDMIKEVK